MHIIKTFSEEVLLLSFLGLICPLLTGFASNFVSGSALDFVLDSVLDFSSLVCGWGMVSFMEYRHSKIYIFTFLFLLFSLDCKPQWLWKTLCRFYLFFLEFFWIDLENSFGNHYLFRAEDTPNCSSGLFMESCNSINQLML